MIILPQVAQDTGSTRPFPRKAHEEIQALRCLCEVWRLLVRTRLNLLKCYIPSGKIISPPRTLRSSEGIAHSTNMQPNFPAFENAHHIVILSGCICLATEGLEFFEARNILQRRTMWHSRLSDYPPLALRSPKQSVTPQDTVFRQWLPQLNCIWEQRQFIMTDFPSSCRDPNIFCKTSCTWTSWNCHRCLPCCTDFFRMNRCYMIMPLCTRIAPISCFINLFCSPLESVRVWRNINRRLSTILSLHSNTIPTRRLKGFHN
jgi:hypothetical protein